MKNTISKFFTFFIFILGSGIIYSQANLSFVRVSPAVSLKQNIGFATVEVNYSSPGAKGRKILGGIVPFGLAPNPFGNGKPMPWRVGANENTTVSFSHDVKVNGTAINAGKYGLHAIVNKDEWELIFSKDSDAWGSFFYEEKNDAARIKASPQEGEFKEWLTIYFNDFTLGSANMNIHWGEVVVPIKIEFDQHEAALDTFRKELSNLQGFNQAAWGAAAGYCLQNNVNLNEAMSWIDKALGMNGGNNFNNNRVKAGLLIAEGESDKGNKLMKEALNGATEAELNIYGYQLMNQGSLEDAIEIFKLNVEKHPDSWNVYDSLGEALNNKGDKKGAEENYKTAVQKAPENQKSRIESILNRL